MMGEVDMYVMRDNGQDKTNTMTNHINTRNESTLLGYHRHYLGPLLI